MPKSGTPEHPSMADILAIRPGRSEFRTNSVTCCHAFVRPLESFFDVTVKMKYLQKSNSAKSAGRCGGPSTPSDCAPACRLPIPYILECTCRLLPSPLSPPPQSTHPHPTPHSTHPTPTLCRALAATSFQLGQKPCAWLFRDSLEALIGCAVCYWA